MSKRIEKALKKEYGFSDERIKEILEDVEAKADEEPEEEAEGAEEQEEQKEGKEEKPQKEEQKEATEEEETSKEKEEPQEENIGSKLAGLLEKMMEQTQKTNERLDKIEKEKPKKAQSVGADNQSDTKTSQDVLSSDEVLADLRAKIR